MPQPAWPDRGRAYYTLVVLTLALLIATIDKGILSVLVEYIKRDLKPYARSVARAAALD